ncbi:MAG: response regulator, partial [Archangium sp.]|nr:response regulator [Archangium sp.]
NISHEIRTPMNGVLGLTEVLLTEPMEPEHTASLELIHRSGQQMVTLLNDLLDATKAQAGKLTIERHDFDLWQLLIDVRGLFGPIAHQKGVHFTLDHPPSLPRYVNQDSARLRQVLSNLISNALKFTTHGGVVLRATPVAPTHIHFEVEDTGLGISAELASRLFKPFEQAEGTANRRQGGTGLGLALSQQLVTLMGGHIDVASTPGRGARFFFSLACGEATASTADLPREAIHRSERDEVVLIVDDNPVNLLVASKLVEKAGFRARPVASGAEALRLLVTEAVSLVLMDCHMPELDGFETTRKIRMLGSASATVPVVALTASTLPDELAACLSSGMNEVLTKPVSLEALASVLDRLMRPARR